MATPSASIESTTSETQASSTSLEENCRSPPPSDPELRSAIEDQVQHELALQEAGSGSRWL